MTENSFDNYEILTMENITKVFPNGTVANDNVNFSLRKGEIHALMGENGAGKSTLMRILYGIESAESGTIKINGEIVNINSSLTAMQLGIGMVHQHFMLIPSLSVYENIMLGHEPTRLGMLLNINEARRLTKEISTHYNFEINPDEIVENLPVSTKQKIEILKALIRDAHILILDEPTAVLTPQETKELFVQLKKLREDGYSIIFISHKLGEIKEICDRMTIMRSGKLVTTCDVDAVSKSDISRMMIGRDISLTVDKKKAEPKEVVLEVKGISKETQEGKPILTDVSFAVRKGEILGIVGVAGNGQSELVDVITGMSSASKGELLLSGKIMHSLNIRERRNNHMAFIPEDRMTFGCAAEMSIEENLISDSVYSKEYNKGVLLNTAAIKNFSNDMIAKYNIKTSGAESAIKTLSGGNIQKVVVARELASDPAIIIADQPSRGIDIGASMFIYDKLVEMRDNGCAVLLISADITEVLELSDYLIVMYGGEIVARFDDVDNLDADELGLYMLGLKRQAVNE